VTVHVELAGVPAESVEPASITANGVRAEARPVAIGDYDLDGVPDLMVRFDARSLLATLSPEARLVVVGGELRDGTPFEGTDTLSLAPLRPHERRGEERGDRRHSAAGTENHERRDPR
jgi:hypothetical protein